MALAVHISQAMTRRSRAQSSWLTWGAVSLTLLFALTAGACLLHDGDMDDHHAMPSSLCLGLLVVSSLIVLHACPLAVGSAPILSLVPVHAATPHIPDPPPKSRSLA